MPSFDSGMIAFTTPKQLPPPLLKHWPFHSYPIIYNTRTILQTCPGIYRRRPDMYHNGSLKRPYYVQQGPYERHPGYTTNAYMYDRGNLRTIRILYKRHTYIRYDGDPSRVPCYVRQDLLQGSLFVKQVPFRRTLLYRMKPLHNGNEAHTIYTRIYIH